MPIKGSRYEPHLQASSRWVPRILLPERFQFINDHHDEWSIRQLCWVMNVSAIGRETTGCCLTEASAKCANWWRMNRRLRPCRTFRWRHTTIREPMVHAAPNLLQ